MDRYAEGQQDKAPLWTDRRRVDGPLSSEDSMHMDPWLLAQGAHSRAAPSTQRVIPQDLPLDTELDVPGDPHSLPGGSTQAQPGEQMALGGQGRHLGVPLLTPSTL